MGLNLCAAWQRLVTARPVWLAGWRSHAGYWWGDRAAALADQLRPGGHVWGAVPPAWRLAFPVLPSLAGAGDDCPVCLSSYDDPLPRPPTAPETSRGLVAVAECGVHATCVACDLSLQRLANGNLRRMSCPLCRAARAHRTRAAP